MIFSSQDRVRHRCRRHTDGACAMVLASESAARRAPNPPAWILGTSMRSEPIFFAGRDVVNPQAGRDAAADVYRQAGIDDPRRLQIGQQLRLAAPPQ